MFFKIVVLKNFVIFTGKYVLESLFDKVDSRDTKEAPTRCFLVNVAKFLRTPFYGTPPVAASAFLKNSYIPTKTSVTET